MRGGVHVFFCRIAVLVFLRVIPGEILFFLFRLVSETPIVPSTRESFESLSATYVHEYERARVCCDIERHVLSIDSGSGADRPAVLPSNV